MRPPLTQRLAGRRNAGAVNVDVDGAELLNGRVDALLHVRL